MNYPASLNIGSYMILSWNRLQATFMYLVPPTIRHTKASKYFQDILHQKVRPT